MSHFCLYIPLCHYTIYLCQSPLWSVLVPFRPLGLWSPGWTKDSQLWAGRGHSSLSDGRGGDRTSLQQLSAKGRRKDGDVSRSQKGEISPMGQSPIPSFPMMFRDVPIFFPTSQMTRLEGYHFWGFSKLLRAAAKGEFALPGEWRVGPLVARKLVPQNPGALNHGTMVVSSSWAMGIWPRNMGIEWINITSGYTTN